jgi:hypothetical protein
MRAGCKIRLVAMSVRRRARPPITRHGGGPDLIRIETWQLKNTEVGNFSKRLDLMLEIL